MVKKFLIKHFNNLWIKYKIMKSNYKIEDVSKSAKKIFIFLAADYRNMGDIAITYAQKMFLDDKFNDYEIIEIPADKTLDYIKPVRNILNENDIITIIGGGNMGDIYEYYENLRRIVINNFKKNLIVSFPQTIDFSDTKKGRKSLKKTIKVIKKHNRIIISARELNSYNKMCSYFGKDKVILVPDIVLYLKNKININEEEKIKIGICFREDKEEDKNKIEIKNKLIEALKEYDVEKFDTYLQENFCYESRYETLKCLLRKISKFKIVYTNRLHAMIFAYLTNTKCIFIDNSNKKISNTYNTWIKDNNNIAELSNIENAIKAIKVNTLKDINNLDKEFDKFSNEIKLKLKEV